MTSPLLSVLNPVAGGFASLLLWALVVVIVYTVVPARRTRVVGEVVATFPPGPGADPVIGHARYIPSHYGWRTFSDWSKKFGDIIYLHVLGKQMVVISSAEAARDLLDKKGANYSDRPRFVHMGEMMGINSMLVFLRYGTRFRKQRRLMQQSFNSKAVASFHGVSRKCTLDLLNNLSEKPEDFLRHIHKWISSALLMVTYGHEVVSEDDRLVYLVERTGAMILEYGAAGSAVVDFIPILRHIPSWFPGAGFKRYAQKTHALLKEMSELPYNGVKAKRAANLDRRSFVNSMLTEYESLNTHDEEYEDNMRSVAAVVYGAGVETTEATIATFFFFMASHPEVMRRAQAEIDKVIGSSRLPTLGDRAELPFIDCIMKETLRLNPPVPLGIPHSSIDDDVYRGMYIPGGSTVVTNIWHMMRDERFYPEPEKFMPERYLHSENYSSSKLSGLSAVSESSGNASDPTSVVFGFGRRICPGRFFADTSMWQVMACVLAVFDIVPALDPLTGKPIQQTLECSPGVTAHPKEFRCKVTLRSAEHKALIDQERSAFKLDEE